MSRRLLLLAVLSLAALRARAADAIAWQPWSDEAFATAKREHKFVIMDLEAVWCHWCHVMDETTYKDPKVIALMGAHYIAVRVDQDSRPDLSNRYEDYGWPATIVFAADGSEIVRRRGYLDPAEMASMLQAIIDDPSPGPSVTSAAVMTYPESTRPGDAQAAGWRKSLLAGYDWKKGGWEDEHKYLDPVNVEYCMRAASRGDPEAGRIARDMLRLQAQLFDPAWGGVYQYSAEGDWVHPHFEKIMAVQSDNLRIYAMAAAQWSDAGYRAGADSIARFLGDFLRSGDGAFYTSQDADLVPGEHAADYFQLGDGARRKRGVPRVDTHRYARENGWAITALCALSDATGEDGPRAEAVRAADWVVANRGLPGGGFRHDAADAAGPYLGDSLSMGSGFLALYEATADPAWLARAQAAEDFIRARFARGGEPGFSTSDTTLPSFPKPQPEFDEEIALVRFSALLTRATGNALDRAVAESSMKWVLSPENVSRRGAYTGGLLLASDELATEPLHVTVVGGKKDPTARALFMAALRAPTAYKLIEWWDPREGPPPRGESIFPDLDHPAAYLCANGACSSPLPDPAALSRRLDRAIAASGQR